jgi:hypothetical protein
VLTPSDLLALQKELRQAFTPKEFRALLAARFGLPAELVVSNPADAGLQALEVIEAAERAGWTAELIRAAFDARPDSLELGRLYRDAGLAPVVQTSDGPRVTTVPLERLKQSAELEGRVCRIEVGAEPRGTGFLVGPNVILTADYLLRGPDGEAWNPAAIRCRFDYRATPTSTNPGTLIGLSDSDGIIYSSPYPSGLGYSLLRLNRPLGEEGVSPGAPPRGWFRLPETDPAISPGRRVLVYFYPASGSLKIGAGTTVGPDPADPTHRIGYAVPLEPGASGAPCLSADGRVIALHQGRGAWDDPSDLRFGVTAAAIRADLQAAGKANALGGESATTPTRPVDPQPPRPGPIRDKDDPQKGRWGGLRERSGRKLSAEITDNGERLFTCSFTVESSDGSELQPPVVFHLHDSFPRMVIRIERIRDRVRAVLEDFVAYGAFTAGAQVKDAAGSWVGLEYDLVNHPDLPKRFLER